jgi:hypothetical protein
MATRTIKLMGKAYSTSGDVSLVVNFNNTEVFNDTVTTVNGVYQHHQESVELATWTIDTSVTGDIPLSIAVSGGDFAFNNLLGNYSGFELNEDGTVAVQPADHYNDMNLNTPESDGKTNISYSPADGEVFARGTITDEALMGDWTYRINDGVTFSCDFVINADLVILTAP